MAMVPFPHGSPTEYFESLTEEASGEHFGGMLLGGG